MDKLFEEAEIIRHEKGKIVVDWKKFDKTETKACAFPKGAWPGLYSSLIKRLMKLDILSREANGNFVLMNDQSCLNPEYNCGLRYFRDRNDAKEYKRMNYGSAPRILIYQLRQVE